jgi:hypothetical protein
MISEEILVCAEKVKGIGKFFFNLNRGELKHSEDDFYMDVGAMLVKTAEEIEEYCKELEPIEMGGVGKEGEA